jgi:hypothetical protein
MDYKITESSTLETAKAIIGTKTPRDRFCPFTVHLRAWILDQETVSTSATSRATTCLVGPSVHPYKHPNDAFIQTLINVSYHQGSVTNINIARGI